MPHTCSYAWCNQLFEVTDEDLAFYDKISPEFEGKKFAIPQPTLCADCRMQRRTAFRNERNLYRNTCASCKKSIISVYAPERGLIVYCPTCWWGDTWSPTNNGVAVDMNQSFFGQVQSLMMQVPFQSNIIINSTNCDYNSYCVNSKNCYMCQRLESEDTMYSYLPIKCVWCADSAYIYRSQYCYECLDCWDCYGLQHARLCKNTSDSAFCYDCVGCKRCIGCAGLRNAENMLFNKPCTPAEFDKAMAALSSHQGQADCAKTFEEIVLQKFPRRAELIERSENVTGDLIFKSRDVHQSFDIEESETVRDSWGVEFSKDIGDSCFIYHGEVCHENMSNSGSSFIRLCAGAYNSNNLTYCVLCTQGASNCFGCINLKGQKYCILNKHYTEEQYEQLVPRIIEKMKADGEWGEFFPVTMSPFHYNETVAQEFFPLTEKEVKERGWRWNTEEQAVPNVAKTIDAAELPDSINDIPDDILSWAIECEATKRPFKIIKQELEFYRKMNLPIPRLHPDERHRRRMAKRNPRKLWNRECAKCDKPIATSYAPGRPETVYCEECYLKTVY